MKLGLKRSIVIALIAILAVTPVWADTTEKPILEIQNAVDRAISRDNTLAKYNRDIAVYKEEKQTIDDVGSYNYTDLTISIDETEQNLIFRKDMIEKNVTDTYQNIVLLEKNIELLETQIELNKKQVRQAEIKKENGYCDELSYEKIVRTLEDNIMSKKQAEQSLEDAKKSFLKLTNINADNYVFDVDTTFEPLVLDKDINAYASGMASKLVEYTNRKVANSEANFWDTIGSSGLEGGGPAYSDYLAAKTKITNAKDSAEDAYDAYKLMIETKYTAINKQMDAVKQLETKYHTGLKDLRVLEIKYNAGYVSSIDYETQKVQLDALEVSYLEKVFAYNQLKAEIEKPWTIGGYES